MNRLMRDLTLVNINSFGELKLTNVTYKMMPTVNQDGWHYICSTFVKNSDGAKLFMRT